MNPGESTWDMSLGSRSEKAAGPSRLEIPKEVASKAPSLTPNPHKNTCFFAFYLKGFLGNISYNFSGHLKQMPDGLHH